MREQLEARSEHVPDGGGKLEGANHLSGKLGLPTLLVREAVQNAWDARDDARGASPVSFRIDGWDLDGEALQRFRELMPVKGLRGFDSGVEHPRDVLKRKTLRVLVISDRKTVGLCGPSRGGVAWEPVRHGVPLERGQQRFANFVRNMGRAATNIGGGDGGAFGVGKSALWMSSECGTILIHTRTTDGSSQGNSVERFIGSIHNTGFEHGKTVYTGRHFIGSYGDDGVAEPLTGADAREAASMLPLPAYTNENGDQVDGTSIVIVAPRLFLPWEIEMRRLRDAVRWHAWPKRLDAIRSENDGPDMDIRLSWNGNEVDIPLPGDDPEIHPYARALTDCARRRKSPEENRDFEARSLRPDKFLGDVKFRRGGEEDQNVFHLTVDRQSLEDAYSTVGDGVSIDDEPAIDFAAPWGQMALVRRNPLLLVCYQAIGGPPETSCEVGVFLSSDDEDVEDSLTRAEPPAHDEWRVTNVHGGHKSAKTFVRKTLEGIKIAKNRLIESVRPAALSSAGSGEQNVSKRLSQGLLGGFGGRKRDGGGGGVGGGGGSKPRVLLSTSRPPRVAAGETVHEVDVSLAGLGAEKRLVRLAAGGAAVDNTGQKMKVDDLVSYQWETMAGEIERGPVIELEADDSTKLSINIVVHGDLRFRPSVVLTLQDKSVKPDSNAEGDGE